MFCFYALENVKRNFKSQIMQKKTQIGQEREDGYEQNRGTHCSLYHHSHLKKWGVGSPVPTHSVVRVHDHFVSITASLG